MIDRSKLQTGDICVVRGGVDWISNIDSWGQWGLCKSPEFGHVWIVRDQYTGAETKPPHPWIFAISEYDHRFDAGNLCILRHKKLAGVEMIGRVMAWLDMHVGDKYPYGWESIGLMGLEALVERGILDKLGTWLKSQDNLADYQHHPVCSQYVWMALCYGLGFDFAAAYGVGAGQIMPGDFYCMKNDFDVVQDLKA